jgi:hypothetical protein
MSDQIVPCKKIFGDLKKEQEFLPGFQSERDSVAFFGVQGCARNESAERPAITSLERLSARRRGRKD